MNQKFTDEDLTTKEAIWVIIFNEQWEILIQDHIKLDFYTIPIWKIKSWENINEVVKNEVYDETWISINKFEEVCSWEYDFDYDLKKIRILNHIFLVSNRNWVINNKEPSKHRWIKFLSIEEIQNFEKISYATKLALEYLKSINYYNK